MIWVIAIFAVVAFVECSEITELARDANSTKCLTPDQSFGLCVHQDQCNSSDITDTDGDITRQSTDDCRNEETICCKPSDIKRLNIIWPSAPNIWSTWPSLPPRPTYPTIFTRPHLTANIRPSTPKPNSSSTSNGTTVSCGQRNLGKEVGYIVGGVEAPAHSWPWAVAVYIGSGNIVGNYRFVCGASLVSSRFVLGAAHCVSHNNRITKPENIKLQIGAHDRRYEGKYYSVDKLLVHSKYDERLMHNDIALFRLSEPIDLKSSDDIAPVCLPSPDIDKRDLTGQMTYLIGWGTISAGGKTSDYLRQVQVPIITAKECMASYNSIMISAKQLCAGYAKGERDSCQGDSGGPMTIKLEDKHRRSHFVQIGIVSWGKGCAEAKYPGVYTKVTSYLDWIQANLRSHQ